MKSLDGIKKIKTKSSEESSVKDLQKRKFVKLAGIAGIGALAYSLIPKPAHGIIFGSSMRTDSVGIKNVSGTQINPATEAKQDDIISAITGSAGLVPDSYDYVALTYVSAGNGIGEIETATYKTGGSGGTTVAILTLAYDANSNLTSVTKV